MNRSTLTGLVTTLVALACAAAFFATADETPKIEPPNEALQLGVLFDYTADSASTARIWKKASGWRCTRSIRPAASSDGRWR